MSPDDTPILIAWVVGILAVATVTGFGIRVGLAWLSRFPRWKRGVLVVLSGVAGACLGAFIPVFCAIIVGLGAWSGLAPLARFFSIEGMILAYTIGVIIGFIIGSLMGWFIHKAQDRDTA
jgi:hypothetical protein